MTRPLEMAGARGYNDISDQKKKYGEVESDYESKSQCVSHERKVAEGKRVFINISFIAVVSGEDL